MQAMILAAGMGRRMGKYTEKHTKCMIRVGGRTLLDRTIESLKAAGIDKLIMIVGYEAEELKNYIDNQKFDIDIEFVHNDDYDKTNNIYSLYLAKEYLKKDDTILIESDLIYDKEIILSLVASKEKNLAVVARYEQWMDGTVVLLDNNNHIVDFIDKEHFRYEDAENYFKTVNIYKFSKEFSANQYLPFLEAYLTAYGVNQYYEQVLKILAHIKNSELHAYILEKENWYEIDDAQDLDIANTIFSQDKDIIKNYEFHFGGYWRFPKVIDFCYLVNPYYPPQKMHKQLQYFFKELLTQYPSGMKIQCLNASSMFNIDEKYLVVGNGAAELINVLGKYIEGITGICVPTFNEYRRCFTKCTFEEIDTSLTNYSFDLDVILEKIPLVNTLILVNPDNPSGAFISYDEITRIMEECKKYEVKLIFDESFIDFAEEDKRYTLLNEGIMEKYDNLIVIKSISKSYGIPGLRLGVLATSNKEVLAFLHKNLAIWNINSFAEYYLQIQRLYKKSYVIGCNKIVEQRNNMVNQLNAIKGLKIYPSQANYILCELDKDSNYSATWLAVELMKRNNILIKTLSSKKGFDGDNFFRIAVRDEHDNSYLISAIKKLLKK